MNRLEQELSPYLNLWAEDSVNWYPWGREPFDRAAQEHKPMRISIGTTATADVHRGTGTAARLTERYFIPVQVDSEEHPDVAAMYAQAADLLVGRRELPLEVFTDETGTPFFATGPLREVELAGLLSGMALHRSSDPSAYARTAEIIKERLLHTAAPLPKAKSREELWETHFKQLQSQYDEENGGFGKGGKQLMPHELLFLLHYARYTGEPLPRQMAEHTLYHMALGGIRDHIGGGFFRRTTDPHWEQPLPEKRLIDQAWTLDVYTRAWQMTGTELFRRVALETADYVIRELRHGAGGFYTAQWSNEGFWLLDSEVVYSTLGQNDGNVFCRQYSIGDTPTVPNLYGGDEPYEDSVLLHDLRMKLYRKRLERGTPQRDDKVQTGENGIMIAALARAGRVLGIERYLTAAANAEEFLRSRLVSPTDLRRYYCHGAAAGDGVMGDFAGYAMGLLALYRCGCGTEYLTHAARLMARADALFSDHENGGWFLSRGDASLLIRPRQLWDRDLPSGWSIALRVLTELSREISHPGLRQRTARLLEDAASAARSGDCAYALTALFPAETPTNCVRR